MVSNTTQQPSPPSPPSCTLSVYTVLCYMEGGAGGGELERRLEGQQFTKLRRKYQHDRLQSVNYNKSPPQSPCWSQFFFMTTFCFGVFIVNQSKLYIFGYCAQVWIDLENDKMFLLLFFKPTTSVPGSIQLFPLLYMEHFLSWKILLSQYYVE